MLPPLKWSQVDVMKSFYQPEYGSAAAIGLDLRASEGGLVVQHGVVTVVPTNIRVEIPPGYYGRIAPRSGLAVQGVDVLAGVIDSDYRGEIKVLLTSIGGAGVVIERHQKVAQLILERADRLPIEYSADLSVTDRGAGGFGSTGK